MSKVYLLAYFIITKILPVIRIKYNIVMYSLLQFISTLINPKDGECLYILERFSKTFLCLYLYLYIFQSVRQSCALDAIAKTHAFAENIQYSVRHILCIYINARYAVDVRLH